MSLFFYFLQLFMCLTTVYIGVLLTIYSIAKISSILSKEYLSIYIGIII